MPGTLQQFLVSATQKAAADLEAAVLRIPEDKRSWSPMDKARTALDQVAECAILNGKTVDMIKTKAWDNNMDFEQYGREKNELAQDWTAVRALLTENTAKVTAAIAAVSDEDLGIEVQMPWASLTMARVLAYPYWNMSYHEGQVNYIASMLGCLQ